MEDDRISVSAVICTTGARIKELTQTLESIGKQTRRPETVVVVDQSGGVLDGLDMHSCVAGLSLRVLESKARSLTIARNTAVDHLSGTCKWILFLDDDVVLDPRFLQILMEASIRYPGSRILFGNIQNIDATPKWFNSVATRLGLQCHGEHLGYRVFRSYKKTMDTNPTQDITADWAPGCAFMVRTDVFESLTFDGQLRAYCLGEDTDFSFQVSRRWKESVYCVSNAKLMHHKAPAGRLARDRLARMRTLYMYYFVHKHLKLGLSLSAYWFSEFAFSLAILVASVLRYKTNPYPLGAHLLSYLDLLRTRKEIASGDLSSVHRLLFPPD